MIRIEPDSFFAVRRQAISQGLSDTFVGSGLQAARDPATGGVRVLDPLGRATRFDFDRRGFIGAVVSPLGRRWEIASTARGRPECFTTPSGARLDLAYDPLGRVVQIARGARSVCQINHDERGAVAGLGYPDGTSTRLNRDPLGRVTRLTDRTEAARTFEYTPDGLVRAMTDGRGQQTHFEYATRNQPTRRLDPLGHAETYEYDPLGLVASIRADDGVGVQIQRDSAGRPVAIAAGEGDVAQFAYNDQGQVVRAANPAATVEFAYDSLGRLISESSASGVVRYKYDAASTLTAIEYPTGELVQFERDDDLRLSRVVDWAGGATTFEHATDDRWLTVRAPSGLVTAMELTVDGLVSEMAVRTPLRPSAGGFGPVGGDDIFATTYQYDAEDRVAVIRDSEHGERHFRYDAEGQVIAAGSEVFAYDPAGNRVQAGLEVAEFDPADQLTRQGTLRCDYDGRGNLVGWLDRGEVWRFEYDGRNRLTRAQSQSGQVVTFAYDAFGRRISKTAGGVTTQFVWAGEHLIREVRSDGLTRDYLYPPGSSTPLLIRERSVIYTVHADHLGTPQRLTDPRGAVVWSAATAAFGAARVTTATIAQPIRLPGHYYDEETGLHYNRSRYYSPRIGRYLTRDPASYLGGLNLYVYAGNDPINEIDPTGLWPSWRTVVPIVVGIAVGIAVVAAVVALAPEALAVGIILAGAAAGAAGAGLNQGLNEDKFCAECIAQAALKGALVGTLAALPFAFLPASAGIAAYTSVGGLSGGIGYTANHFLTPGSPWSWKDFSESVALGAGTAGAGRYLGSRYAGKPAITRPPLVEEPTSAGTSSAVDPPAGPTEPYNRLKHYGRTPTQADRVAVGAGPGQVADHDPPLVQRYYEGDPSIGEPPGYQMTDAERQASAGDRSRMSPQSQADSNQQGGQMSQYSRQKKKEFGW